MGGRVSGTPASALRFGFREVSDRASGKMVCCARAISLMWMILRVSRRMDAEALYDRARLGSSALVAARSLSFWRCRAGRSRCSFTRTIELHNASSATQSDRVLPYARRARSHVGCAPSNGVMRKEIGGEGVSVPRGGAPRRSKRPARQFAPGSQRVSRRATTSGALATDRRTKNAVTQIRESATPCDAATTRYIFGSSMMCAFGVPGNINHGVPSAGFTERPVDAAVAPGR